MAVTVTERQIEVLNLIHCKSVAILYWDPEGANTNTAVVSSRLVKRKRSIPRMRCFTDVQETCYSMYPLFIFRYEWCTATHCSLHMYYFYFT